MEMRRDHLPTGIEVSVPEVLLSEKKVLAGEDVEKTPEVLDTIEEKEVAEATAHVESSVSDMRKELEDALAMIRESGDVIAEDEVKRISDDLERLKRSFLFRIGELGAKAGEAVHSFQEKRVEKALAIPA